MIVTLVGVACTDCLMFSSVQAIDSLCCLCLISHRSPQIIWPYHRRNFSRKFFDCKIFKFQYLKVSTKYILSIFHYSVFFIFRSIQWIMTADSYSPTKEQVKDVKMVNENKNVVIEVEERHFLFKCKWTYFFLFDVYDLSSKLLRNSNPIKIFISWSHDSALRKTTHEILKISKRNEKILHLKTPLDLEWMIRFYCMWYKYQI